MIIERLKHYKKIRLHYLFPCLARCLAPNFIAGRANTLLINLFKNMKKQITWAMINKKKTSKLEVVVAIIAVITAIILIGTPNL